ncbi:MAG: ATP-dependent DNA helicase [Leptospiraceae bacterium]|nr:ATP-dependent DNA helicase [Leptospiraceae bacterium]MDW8307115.1 ATP-dependent DNA helicase [Leptospiraceae bacterium]
MGNKQYTDNSLDSSKEEISFSAKLPPWCKATAKELSPKEIIQKAFQLLQEKFPGYNHRPAQQAMSEDILQNFLEGNHLVLEAGTGTGKSFAYLIAALAWSYLSGGRVLVVTETKNLQLQLLEKDLPTLCSIFNIKEKIYALALGSANYLCRLRYEKMLAESRFAELADKASRQKFQAWAEQVFSNESLLGHLFEDNSYWPKSLIPETCRQAEGCPGPKCIYYSGCNYYRARKSWERSRIIVTNFHLWLQHLLNEKSVLPQYGVTIVDEAHGFQEIAYRVLTVGYSRQDLQLIRDRATKQEKKFTFLKDNEKRKLEELWSKLSQKWDAFYSHLETELGLVFENNKTKTIREIKYLDSELSELFSELENTYKDLQEKIEESHSLKDDEESYILNHLRALSHELGAMRDFTSKFGKFGKNEVFWAEKKEGKFSLYTSTIDLSQKLWEKIDTCCLFTSATIGHWGYPNRAESIEKKVEKGYFNFFTKQLFGASSHVPIFEKIYPSSFDYENQVLLYIPTGLEPPEYSNHELDRKKKLYRKNLFRELVRLIEFSQGGALVLFTSNDLLRLATRFLKKRKTYPVFSQLDYGAADATHLFKLDPNAILLGVRSLWQGVDLPGRGLRLLVITKLMFQPPHDPMFKARCDSLQKNGGNPFTELSLPLASIMLRQGFGRLIRKEDDKGVVAILDSRLLSKQYGNILLANLPVKYVIQDFHILKKRANEVGIFSGNG